MLSLDDTALRPRKKKLCLLVTIVTNIGAARQFLEILPSIKFRETPFNGFRVFIGIWSDARSAILVGAVLWCKYIRPGGEESEGRSGVVKGIVEWDNKKAALPRRLNDRESHQGWTWLQRWLSSGIWSCVSVATTRLEQTFLKPVTFVQFLSGAVEVCTLSIYTCWPWGLPVAAVTWVGQLKFVSLSG
jgi:hypothetical protein